MQTASEISIRPASILDFDVMCEIELDPENGKYTTLEMPNVDDIRAFLLAGQNIHRDKQIRYAVSCQGYTVGFVDLSDVNFESRTSSVGIFVLNKFRRLGYAKKSLDLLGFRALEFGILKLHAEVISTNTESIRLFLSAGYTESECIHANRRFIFTIPLDAS